MLALGLDQLDVTPAREVEREVLVGDAADQVRRAAELQVQECPGAVRVDPEPEPRMPAQVERRVEGLLELRPGALPVAGPTVEMEAAALRPGLDDVVYRLPLRGDALLRRLGRGSRRRSGSRRAPGCRARRRRRPPSAARCAGTSGWGP